MLATVLVRASAACWRLGTIGKDMTHGGESEAKEISGRLGPQISTHIEDGDGGKAGNREQGVGSGDGNEQGQGDGRLGSQGGIVRQAPSAGA